MSTMNPLLERLQSCPTNAEDIHKYFSETANLLMKNYVISKHNIEYEIVEIEFYLSTPNHPDVITYPRKCKAGQWFFHQSGVDLTFTSNDEQFGGILIRGLRETKGERKQIFGPQNCVFHLWDQFNAFEAVDTEIPIIIPSNGCIEKFDCVCFPRWIPVKKDKAKATAKIAEWIKRVKDEVNDTEKIAELVFESKYRFINVADINFEDVVWKRYGARIPKN